MSFSRLDCVMAVPETGMVIAAGAYPVGAERLFRALTERTEIERWWGGGRGGSLVTWEGRAESGAPWHAVGVFPGGRRFSASGVFLEISPGQRILQSWQSDWDDLRSTEASIRLETIEDGSVLTLVHKGFQSRLAACQIQAQIWWRVLKWIRLDLTGDAMPMTPDTAPLIRRAPAAP